VEEWQSGPRGASNDAAIRPHYGHVYHPQTGLEKRNEG